MDNDEIITNEKPHDGGGGGGASDYDGLGGSDYFAVEGGQGYEGKSFILPRQLWRIEVPAGGDFSYQTPNHIGWWQRFWLRFIGWKVTYIGD